MSSQRETAVELAWPTFEKWVTDELKKAREGFGLAGVLTERSADTLAAEALRNHPAEARPLLRDELHVAHLSSRGSSPKFWRMKSMFAKGRHESWLDVLRQIADESERQKAGVTEWVGSVVRAEVGLAWREIDPDPLALVPNVSCLIDDTTVERCRAALGAGGRSLWFLSSDDPETFTTSAKEALKEHVVSWAPEGMFNAKQVVVVSLGLLDVVMLRHTTPPLAWDYSDRGGVDLFLEQLLAIDVIRRPKAVQFTRLP